MKIKDKALFRQKNYINGKWVDSADGAKINVTNPSTGKKIGSVPSISAKECAAAVDAANAALPGWRATDAKTRANILRKWFDLCMAAQDDLGMILTTEQGKPLAEGKGEIAYGASFLEWFAEEGKRAYGDIIPATSADKRIMVLKQPVGVVAAITPWNFPCAMIARKVGAALAAGCTIVIKPASATPFTALAMAELAERAGVPKGVINVLNGSARVIGGELTSNPIVRKLTFTGSTEVGKILLEQCAATVKKVSMELGGNAPFIVFEDADLDAAVEGCIISKFRNAGQTCVCANRIYVHDKVYDAFACKLKAAVKKLTMGDGLKAGVQIGPMIDMAGVEKVEEHIADAVEKGGKIVLGGKRDKKLGGSFFPPTIIVDAPQSAKVSKEETFGPLAALIRFKSEKKVIEMANDTEFGLACYYYTKDIARSWRVSEALDYGIVGLNTGLISTEVAPFGGVKESGVGREGSKYGLDDYMEAKYVCVGGVQ